MRHLKKGRKFGRERDQRNALTKSVVSALFLHGSITTTEAKAKEIRPLAERAITRAKKGAISDRRMLARDFTGEVMKKIGEHAAKVQSRTGGYTRIIKTGIRKSDSAHMAMLELIRE